MATRAQVQAAAVAFRDQFAPILIARQNAFFASRGRYWQGIRTHVLTPEDGTETAPATSAHPTDQPESWADLNLNLPATLPFTLAVNAYNGPAGHGYEVVVVFHYGVDRWHRTWNVGPETHRASGWISAPRSGV